MGQQTPRTEGGPEPAKPSLRTQAAKALSQLGLTCYVLLLVLALLATAGRDPRIAILMAACAAVPLVFGPRVYRIIGLVALLVAGGLYLSAEPQPQRPGANIPQRSPAGVAPSPPVAAPEPSQR
jgi:hypothetical protein